MTITWTVEYDGEGTRRPDVARRQFEAVLALFTDGRAKVVHEERQAAPKKDAAAGEEGPGLRLVHEERRTPPRSFAEDGGCVRGSKASRRSSAG